MACEIELEVSTGTAPGELTTRVLQAPSGGGLSATTYLDVDGLLRQRDTLEALILASGAPGRGSPGERLLRQTGGLLFDALFTGPVLGTYRASMGVALERREPLRVVLRLTAPRLAALPWEALFDADTETYICRKEQLVRHVPAPFTPDPLDLVPPLRVLGLVASPAGTAALDVRAEQHRLATALAEPIANGLIELQWVAAASWDAVQERLLSGQWHALHFIGHGEYDMAADQGVLSLMNADGSANPIEAQRLADLLNDPRAITRLVVLNSCSSGEEGTRDLFSGTAAELVRSGISAVAAMQFTVSDAAAVAFARGFYTALAHGRGVDEATRSGRIAILGTSQTLEWVTPVLYVRGDAMQLYSLSPPSAATRGPASADPPPAGSGRQTPRKGRKALIGGLAAVTTCAALAAGLLLWPRETSERGGSAGTGPPAATGVAQNLLSVGRIDANLGNACENQKGWVFPQTIDTLPMVTHVSDEAWVARYGGVPASGDFYKFSLSALTPASVLIEAVDVKVVSRTEPVRGVYPAPWTGGCGGLAVTLFRANLDNSPVSLVAVPDADLQGTGDPLPLPHLITENEPEVWYVSAVTQTCSCEWVAEIRWRVGERTGVETLDDAGRPFRVTATTSAIAIDNQSGTLDAWRVTPAG